MVLGGNDNRQGWDDVVWGGGGCDGEAAKKAAAGWKERRGRQHGVATVGG
jgi:hypothetical protein